MARELRGGGLLLREIAERMGVAVSTVGSWLTDPDGSRLRARKDGYRGVCEVCGAPTTGGNGYLAPRMCHRCNAIAAGERNKEQAAPQRALIEQLWAEGKTCREIGELLGWTGEYLIRGTGILRSRGYDLPLRNPGSSAAKRAHWAARKAAA